jgi:TPR repeat protein
MYEHGVGVTASDQEAARWYKIAADRGEEKGAANLGRCYRDGRGVRQDDREAVRLLRIAAEAGDAAAQSDLGVAYGRGRGVARSNVEALKWFTIAIKKGDSSAQTNRNFVIKRISAPEIEEAERKANEFIPKETHHSPVRAPSPP